MTASAQLPAKRLGQVPPLMAEGGGSPPGPAQVGGQGQQPHSEAEADEQLQAELEQGRARVGQVRLGSPGRAMLGGRLRQVSDVRTHS